MSFERFVHHGFVEKPINLEHLRRIMYLRLLEVFEIIERDLTASGMLNQLRAGVLLAGGGARVPRINQLAEQVFQLPAATCKSTSINGLTRALDQPEFATGIGLVKFGALQQKRRVSAGLLRQGLKQTLTGLFKRT